MARRPSVRYYASKGGYFTERNGNRVRLATGPDDAPDGPTYRAALKAFLEIECPGNRSSNHTFASLTALFLKWLESCRKGRTVEIRRKYLLVFVDQIGTVVIDKLCPQDV